MVTKDKLQTDLITAMKARDTPAVTGLRAVLTAVKEAEVSGSTATDLDETSISKVISTEIRNTSDMAASFRDGDRLDRADAAEAVVTALSVYLPTPLTDDEVFGLVSTAISETGATSRKDMGAVMRVVTVSAQGRAEGRRLSAAVATQLG